MTERLDNLRKDIYHWMLVHLNAPVRAVVISLGIVLGIVIALAIGAGLLVLWLGPFLWSFRKDAVSGTESILGTIWLIGLPGFPYLVREVYKDQPELKEKRKSDEV